CAPSVAARPPPVETRRRRGRSPASVRHRSVGRQLVRRRSARVSAARPRASRAPATPASAATSWPVRGRAVAPAEPSRTIWAPRTRGWRGSSGSSQSRSTVSSKRTPQSATTRRSVDPATSSGSTTRPKGPREGGRTGGAVPHDLGAQDPRLARLLRILAVPLHGLVEEDLTVGDHPQVGGLALLEREHDPAERAGGEGEVHLVVEDRGGDR